MTQTQLYLISPPQIPDVKAFAITLEETLKAGEGIVGAFQLRLKLPTSELVPGALTLPSAPEEIVSYAIQTLLPVCHAFSVPLILNDSAQLASECGVDGVHLGQEDGNIKDARVYMGDGAIGATCHDSRHLAMEAAEQGADYVAFGAFYPTTSKTKEAQEKWGVPDPDILHWWSTFTNVPCVAIGGITPLNAKPLIEAGADFLAVITSVWNHKDGPTAAMQEFSACLR